MPQQYSSSSEKKSFISPGVLAVGIAAVLVLGLFAAMVGGGSLASGTRLVGPDGCTAQTWRNPVTGRTEAVGRSRLDAGGRPLCR